MICDKAPSEVKIASTIFYECDLKNRTSLRKLVYKITDDLGPIDIIIDQNASVTDNENNCIVDSIGSQISGFLNVIAHLDCDDV
jgi:enoyl-[acyl-carrier-protein] reductase (NADH)